MLLRYDGGYGVLESSGAISQRGSVVIESAVLIVGLLFVVCLAVEAFTWCWMSTLVQAKSLDLLCDLECDAVSRSSQAFAWESVRSDSNVAIYEAVGISEDKKRDILWKAPVSPSEFEEFQVGVTYRVVHAGAACEYRPLTPFGCMVAAMEGKGTTRLRTECVLTGISTKAVG